METSLIQVIHTASGRFWQLLKAWVKCDLFSNICDQTSVRLSNWRAILYGIQWIRGIWQVELFFPTAIVLSALIFHPSIRGLCCRSTEKSKVVIAFLQHSTVSWQRPLKFSDISNERLDCFRLLRSILRTLLTSQWWWCTQWCPRRKWWWFLRPCTPSILQSLFLNIPWWPLRFTHHLRWWWFPRTWTPILPWCRLNPCLLLSPHLPPIPQTSMNTRWCTEWAADQCTWWPEGLRRCHKATNIDLCGTLCWIKTLVNKSDWY